MTHCKWQSYSLRVFGNSLRYNTVFDSSNMLWSKLTIKYTLGFSKSNIVTYWLVPVTHLPKVQSSFGRNKYTWTLHHGQCQWINTERNVKELFSYTLDGQQIDYVCFYMDATSTESYNQCCIIKLGFSKHRSHFDKHRASLLCWLLNPTYLFLI